MYIVIYGLTLLHRNIVVPLYVCPSCELSRRAAEPDACIRTAQLLVLMLISSHLNTPPHRMMLWMSLEVDLK